MLGLLRNILPEKIPFLCADFYSAGPAKMYAPLYRLIAQEASAAATGRLLDIGTGPGILPLELGTLSPSARIIGMDVSHRMIEIANRNKKVYGRANVDFWVTDARALPLKDNVLDFIISTDSLHHWKQPVRILNEMHRCLKPGCQAWVYDGFSGVSNEDIDSCIPARSGFLAIHPLVRVMLGIHGFSKKEYDTVVKKMISQSLFKTCACEQRGIMMRLCLHK